MSNIQTEIPLGATVKLQPGFDELYQLAFVGSTGLVKDHRQDMGFDQIWVQWNTDDWQYNGERDGWAFASHFKVIELPDEPVHPKDFEPQDSEAPAIMEDSNNEQMAQFIEGIT